MMINKGLSKSTRLSMTKLRSVFLTLILVSCNAFFVTENSAPVSFATQTSLPTLSPTQVSETVRDLYKNNGGCKLPCFLGIVPGKTSIQDVYSRFSLIGYFEDQTRAVDTYQHIAFATIVPPNDLVGTYNDNRWGFSIRVEDGIVVGFVTGANDIEEFSIPDLAMFLSYFGKPEEIMVRVIESQVGNPDYEIALFYPTKGIFIRWRGETDSIVAQTKQSITVMACPRYMPIEADTLKGSSPPFFYLFPPDEKMPFDEIIKTHLSEDPSGSSQLLDKANMEKFYTMYLDPAIQDCFPLSYSF